MEYDLNRILLQTHKEVNKECYWKNKSRVWAFFSHFGKLLAMMELSGIIAHRVIVLSWAHSRKWWRGWLNTRKNTYSSQNHVLHGHANKFTSFLSFLELRKTSQIYDRSELSTDDGSRKRRKSDKVSVGGGFLDYLLPCHPYGDNHPKQREFEGNIVAFMAHVFTSLLLVDHDCFHKLARDLDPSLQPIGRSKLLRNLIPTGKQLVKRSGIERLAKVKTVAISYDPWMSRKSEEFF